MAEPTPFCPVCQSTMVQKQARRGPNAGRYFWSCSRYPQCRGTRDVDAGESPTSGVNVRAGLDLPVPWTGPQHEHGLSVLFQAGGGRLSLEGASEIGAEAVGRANLSNWCLIDHTVHVDPPVFDRRERQALAVVRKLLSRGRRPVVSPAVEESVLAAVADAFPHAKRVGSAGEIRFEVAHRRQDRLLREQLALAAAAGASVAPSRRWELDSDDERAFLHEVFPATLGQVATGYLHPQVPVSNLLMDRELQNARVDFLFTPPGGRPLVIEVDGEQHEKKKAADAERDRMLLQAGFEVVRLPTAEASSGHGLGWQRIREAWQERQVAERVAEPWALRLLWQPTLITRIQLAVLYAVERGILGPGADCWELRICEQDYSAGELALTELRELFLHVERLYGTQLWPSAIHLTTLRSGQVATVMLGHEEQRTGITDYLDLDVSAHISYLQDVPIESNPLRHWGDRPLLEVRAANIPRHVAFLPAPAVETVSLHEPDPDVLTYFLRTVFRKCEFRGGQLEAVIRTLKGQDSLVLLPTGAGKSLIYQLAGLLLPGVTMVVDPIVSLIEDQIYNLKRYGIDRAIGISSLIEDAADRQAALLAFGKGEFLFCFVAPERLQTPQFRTQCHSLKAFTGFNLWVVDEAHCVSEWGHEFRTAYLNLGRIARNLGRSGPYVPPVLALTGTASRAVLRDVQRELQIIEETAVIRPPSFDRAELNFAVVKAPSRDKKQVLVGVLQRIMGDFGVDPATFFEPAGDKTRGGLVFCPHVEGGFGVVQVAQTLRDGFPTEVNIYAGQAPKGFDGREWNRVKTEHARRFKENEYALLVATKAFGMGIDKPNIRYTVHLGIPGSLEAFYQEAGRAGRDRQTAHNVVVFSDDQPERARQLLDPDLTLDRVRGIRRTDSRRDEEDDVGRQFFFHFNAFAGVDEELREVDVLIDELGVIDDRVVRTLSYADHPGRATREKAIHRLLLLGIVEDYTLDYSTRQFELVLVPPTRERVTDHLLRYVGAYNMWRARAVRQRLEAGPSDDVRAFVMHAARVLLEFVYEVIERGRRVALREMYLAARHCQDGEDMRRRLLDYLQESRFSKAIEELPAVGAFEAQAFEQVIELAAVPADAREMRGATMRLLESQPDSPSLLILRGFLEAVVNPHAIDDLRDYVTAGVHSLRNRYAATEDELTQATCRVVGLARTYVPDGLGTVTAACVDNAPGAARALLRAYEDEEIVRPAAAVLLSGVAAQLEELATALT